MPLQRALTRAHIPLSAGLIPYIIRSPPPLISSTTKGSPLASMTMIQIPMTHHQILPSLERQYLQLVDPALLPFPPLSTLRSPSFQSALYSTLFDDSRSPYPPPRRYTARVLKRLISLLSEPSGNHPKLPEIDESILTLFTTLIATPSVPHQREAVTYTLPPSPFSGRRIGPAITLLESRNVISGAGTTGLRTWEAALALGEYLIANHLCQMYKNTPYPCAPRIVGHRDNILELGAGTGILSIILARLGAIRVLATDGNAGVCDALEKNMDVNGVSDVVAVRQLWWGQEEDQDEAFDVVVGADVTYDSSVIPSLVSQLKSLFARNPRVKVVISATIRNEETYGTFRNSCAKNGLILAEQLWTQPSPPVFFYPTSTPIRIVHISQNLQN
ncbi:hypothetical protein RUND412_000578 [Rhizina undulata]